MGDGWEIATIVLAIVAFFLLVLVIIETALIVVMFGYGIALEDMEIECANDICGAEEYTSYHFDDYTGTCYCYIGNEIALKQVIDY